MINYVSIDIETTGLDPDYCQVLEIGAVFETWDRPVEQLESFQVLVKHDRIVGSPYALAMNVDILRELGNGRGVSPGDAISSFYAWLFKVGACKDGMYLGGPVCEQTPLTFAGKNFGKFDYQFLKQMPGWDKINHRVSHRFIDPAGLYWQEGDVELPGTAACLKRAGLDADVKHRAVADAQDVIRLVRFAKGVK